MATIEVPYHRSKMSAYLPDDSLVAVLSPKPSPSGPPPDQHALVEAALDNPVNSLRLEELAHGKSNIVIITSDHTRPMPSSITMPILLRRIRQANKDAAITILIATGYHRPMTSDEIISRFGREIASVETIINHISSQDEDMVYLGTLPSGGELHINRIAAQADLLIAEGFIEPHFFAGFSGGRKSVLPGIAGAKTVLANHCAKFVASPEARTGNLRGNPIHEDMIFAASKANLAFILNVVLDEHKRIIYAVAGDMDAGHERGCGFVKTRSSVKAVEADIVVTSNGGYPLDQNIYQSVKSMTAAESCCRPGGVIIEVSGCCDGHGGSAFYETMKNASCPMDIIQSALATPADSTVPDQWESQILARVLHSHKVILVSDICDPQMVRDMHMLHAHDLKTALDMAFDMIGPDAKVAVIPDGVGVIVDNC